MKIERALELVEKSALSDSAKKACKEGFGSFKKAWGELPDEMKKSISRAMGFMGDDEDSAEKEKAALKKSADDSAAEVKRIREVVQKSVAYLDAKEPAIAPALADLAGLVGHTTVNQIIAALPPEARARFEMLEKSAKESSEALALLQKSQADAAKADRVRVMVAKAETTLKHVPLKTSSIGEILATVQAADSKAADSLYEMLVAVDGVMAKSAAFTELGSSAQGPKAGSAWEQVENMAKALQQKSSTEGKAIPMSKARTFIMEANPALAKQVETERAQG